MIRVLLLLRDVTLSLSNIQKDLSNGDITNTVLEPVYVAPQQLLHYPV